VKADGPHLGVEAGKGPSSWFRPFIKGMGVDPAQLRLCDGIIGFSDGVHRYSPRQASRNRRATKPSACRASSACHNRVRAPAIWQAESRRGNSDVDRRGVPTPIGTAVA
jgi:hypothetical protein